MEEVIVLEKDKTELINLCEQIGRIVDKYPRYSNADSYYITTISRVKDTYYRLSQSVRSLTTSDSD